MDIHPINDLNECKIEHEDDSETIVNNLFSITYTLD